jgi:putative transposase
LSRASKLLGITRQAIYQRAQRETSRALDLACVKEMVLEIRRFMPRLGGKKLYFLLKEKFIAQGIKLGRDNFFTYLKDENLLVKPKRSYTKTTHSKHWMKKHPNLLKDLTPQAPEQVFVSDITYVKSAQGVHYLSLVTDAYRRKIMGYELSNEMKATDVVKALDMTVNNRQHQCRAIHHSDRGLQYCSEVYQDKLAVNNITPSMTDGYDCYQNALAERINGILKQEFLLYKCQNIEELKQLVEESILIYNEMRPHLSLGLKTPNQVHKKGQEQKLLAFH